VPESASGVQQHPAAPFPSPPSFVRPELCPEIGERVRTRWLAGDVAVPFVVDFGGGGGGGGDVWGRYWREPKCALQIASMCK
jgi:hypothetical protein